MFFYQGSIKDAGEEYRAFLLDLDENSQKPPIDNNVEVKIFKDSNDRVHIQVQQPDETYVDYALGVDQDYVDNKALEVATELVSSEEGTRALVDGQLADRIDEVIEEKEDKFSLGQGLEFTSDRDLNVKIDGSTIKTDANGVLYADVTGASYTEGDAISLDNNTVSVKYDDDTLKLDADGTLYVAQVPGAYAPGQAIDIDVDNKISAKVDGTSVVVCPENYISLPIKTKKVDTYLYSIEYDDVDWDYIKAFSDYWGDISACTSVRYNEFHARNYDWTFSDNVEFIVKTSAGIGRFGSIGVARIDGVTPELIEAGNRFIYKVHDDVVGAYDWTKLLPGFTVDGINEKGVCCNVNVTQIDDEHPKTEHTHLGQVKMYARNVVRYILDNATSAKDAVNRIKDNLDIYTGCMADGGHNLHYMISDKLETYIVELVGDSIKVINCTKDKVGIANSKIPYAVMTNFYLSDADTVDKNTGELDIEKLAPMSAGVERYNIALDRLKGFDDLDEVTWENLETLMHNLWYTRTYTNDMTRHYWHEDTGWFSEYVGGTYTVQDAMNENVDFPDELQEIHDWAKTQILMNTRDDRLWHTMHTSIYDLDNFSLIILSQEKTKIYNFELGEVVFKNQIEDLRNFLMVANVSRQPHSLVFNNVDSNLAGGLSKDKDCASAFGSGNRALGNSSVAFGHNNTAEADASSVFGKGNVSNVDYQMVIGQYNNPDEKAVVDGVQQDFLFVIGGGDSLATGATIKKNVFAVDRLGNIHIPNGCKVIADLS